MFEGQSVSVIIPAFNEADHIGRVVRNIPSWVDHIVVVDDGSRDLTVARAEETGRAFELIRHDANRGVGAAIISGYEAAVARGVDIAAIMAGDDQMCPDELVDLVSAVFTGEADYAKGTRMGHPGVRGSMPRWRRLGNAGLTWWTRRLTGLQELSDAQCGFTAIRVEVLAQLKLTELPQGYGYPNRLLMMLSEVGARVVDVPVTPIYANELSGLTPLKALRTHGAIMARATLRMLQRRVLYRRTATRVRRRRLRG